MRTWRELLGVVREIQADPERFGPHTKALMSALAVLQRTRWYASVGTPSSFDAQVVRVRSWDEAWQVLGDMREERYAIHGTLLGPSLQVGELIERDPQRHAWWRFVRKLMLDSLDVESPPTQPGWDSQKTAFTMDYPHDLLDHLLKEIIVADQTSCTYFREQFQWLAYGYFPCGWDGGWPSGRMRVF